MLPREGKLFSGRDLMALCVILIWLLGFGVVGVWIAMIVDWFHRDIW